MISSAYIALGSNLEHPLSQLQNAVRTIGELDRTTVTALSRIYCSAALGPADQTDYLNAVIAVATELEPQELLTMLQEIENRQGRTRTQRWGARTLDLDILLYGTQNIQTETLVIPHPAMASRHFVLYPLAEIAGSDLVLPCGSVLDTLLARCSREGLKLSEQQFESCAFNQD